MFSYIEYENIGDG